MKQIYFIFLFLIFISGASALNVYAGEPTNITLTEQYDYYSIVGNSTPVELDITQNGLELIITFNKYQQEDNFELIFFNKEKETITVYQSGGGSSGGGTRTIYKDRNITEYVYRDRDVEKIVEVEDQEEIDRLLGIANDAVKGEWKFKTLFLLACAILLIMIILKIKNTKMEDKN